MNDKYIQELTQAIEHTCIYIKEKAEPDYKTGMSKLVSYFIEHKEKESQIFFVGNGGSSAIASHMTADFMKNGGMNTCSVCDIAVTTCIGNDYGYEYVFSKPLKFMMKKNDLLIAISSSGNSKNIIYAIEAAREKGAEVVTFTGFKADNPVKQMGNINVYVPCEKYGIVESIHNLILQQIVDLIMAKDGVRI